MNNDFNVPRGIYHHSTSYDICSLLELQKSYEFHLVGKCVQPTPLLYIVSLNTE